MKKNVFIATLVFILSGCGMGKSVFKDAANWVPADFNPKECILLVQEFPGDSKKANNELQGLLDSTYKGQFEIVSKKTIEEGEGKYGDTKFYRYAVLWERRYTQWSSASSSSKKLDIDGRFYDRNESHRFPITKDYNRDGNRSYIPFFAAVNDYLSKKAK
jgi:Prokaryotic membrane lipoprotein lipid attachment site